MDSALQQHIPETEAELAPADELATALARARDALLARQHSAGYWCYELEADCTIPAEYIMMMHMMDEIEPELEAKLAVYLRAHQDAADGWSLYPGGDFELSCSVKAYYALKLAGDDPNVEHMVRARQAILAAGGAARANVFTRIALALFGELPWRGVPFIPAEIMLLPHWFSFHLSKVSYWSRTVMVPLFILCSVKPRAQNPREVHVPELFTTPPEHENHYFTAQHTPLSRIFLLLDRLGRRLEPFIPERMRECALQRAEEWTIERLNGEDGLGAIFPAMVNAYEALVARGYPTDHPYCTKARNALRKLVVEHHDSAYCQPCVSPVWDTGLAALALQAEGSAESAAPLVRALDWLDSCQVRDHPGDWRFRRPRLAGGGWAFQFANPHYPDLDDSAVVAWALQQAEEPERYHETLTRAADWLRGMQSRNGGFAAFDVDNIHYYLNEIPFADHGALLDPPTSDVSARVLAYLSRLNRPEDQAARARCLDFLKQQQEPDGAWFGRWGTNYIYGTWSVLSALEQAGEPCDQLWIRRAVAWLKQVQKPDGGWGEGNSTYFDAKRRGRAAQSTSFHTAWALLGLMAAGEGHSDAVRHGVDYLIRTQRGEGGWYDPEFTAPGFPRVFYLKYHGYSVYFPLWALAHYRRIQ